MNMQRCRAHFLNWKSAMIAAVVAFLTPMHSYAQVDVEAVEVEEVDEVGKAPAKAPDAAGGVPAADPMERLQGAAGVGVETGAGEAVKGGSMKGAAQKGGGAAVQDYMKGPQGAAAGAADTGGAVPKKGMDDGSGAPDTDLEK